LSSTKNHFPIPSEKMPPARGTAALHGADPVEALLSLALHSSLPMKWESFQTCTGSPRPIHSHIGRERLVSVTVAPDSQWY
jgi:hypothetical protein